MTDFGVIGKEKDHVHVICKCSDPTVRTRPPHTNELCSQSHAIGSSLSKVQEREKRETTENHSLHHTAHRRTLRLFKRKTGRKNRTEITVCGTRMSLSLIRTVITAGNGCSRFSLREHNSLPVGLGSDGSDYPHTY